MKPTRQEINQLVVIERYIEKWLVCCRYDKLDARDLPMYLCHDFEWRFCKDCTSSQILWLTKAEAEEALSWAIKAAAVDIDL